MGSANREHTAPLRRRARAGRVAAVLALLAALALPVAIASGQSIDDLNSRIAGARDQADSIGAEIQAATEQLRAAQEQAIAAAAREAQLSAVLERGEQREAALEDQVAQARGQLTAARAELRHSLNALSDRLVGIYRGGMPDATTLLLESNGFDDLTTRAEYLRRIEEADAALVSKVRSLRNAVADRLAEVQKAQQRAHAFNERIAAARDQIARVRANAESQAAALEDARARRQAALDSLQSQVDGWTSEVQRLERISAQQAEQKVAGWFGDWAIPASIVMCESGGNFGAVNPSSGAGGAYQILPSTWDLYGGQGNPENASPAEQAEIAAQIWADSGAGAWECAG